MKKLVALGLAFCMTVLLLLVVLLAIKLFKMFPFEITIKVKKRDSNKPL